MLLSLINRLETDFNSYLFILGLLTRSTSNHATIFLLIQSNSQTSRQTISLTSSQLSFTRIINRNIHRRNLLTNLTSNTRNLTHRRRSRAAIVVYLCAFRSSRTLVLTSNRVARILRISNPITIIILSHKDTTTLLNRTSIFSPINTLKANSQIHLLINTLRRSTTNNTSRRRSIELNSQTNSRQLISRARQITSLTIISNLHTHRRNSLTNHPLNREITNNRNYRTTISINLRASRSTSTLISSIRNTITIRISVCILDGNRS